MRKKLFQGKHDAFFEDDKNSQSELFYYDNEQEEIKEHFSGISVEEIKEETHKKLEIEKEEDTVQFHKLEPILSEENFSQLVEMPVKSYSNSYILDDIQDEYKEGKEEREDWEHSYEEENEVNEFSYYKESDEGSREKIRKSLTIEERLNLIMQIKSAMNEHKILKLKNNYLHQNCCKILVAYSRMDTVDRGLDQNMVHNDLR